MITAISWLPAVGIFGRISVISAGQVQRGAVSRIAAAILFADVRGFTNFAEETAPEEVARRLNGIFDCLGDSVRTLVCDFGQAGDEPALSKEELSPAVAGLSLRVARGAHDHVSDELASAVIPGSPADFGRLVGDEIQKWAKVVKFSGAKPE